MRQFNVYIQCAATRIDNVFYKAKLVRLKDTVEVADDPNPHVVCSRAVSKARKDLHVLYPVVEECDSKRQPIHRPEKYYQLEI